MWLITAAAAPGPITVEVCASTFAGDCCGVFSITIEVKFCPGAGDDNNFYVYKLKNVPVCDMAYCAVGSYDGSNNTCKYYCCLRCCSEILSQKKTRSEMRSVFACYRGYCKLIGFLAIDVHTVGPLQYTPVQH